MADLGQCQPMFVDKLPSDVEDYTNNGGTFFKVGIGPFDSSS